MARVAPKLRRHLSADALFRKVRTAFADIADHRQGDVDIPLADALMSAFAMFSLKAPSLLAFDKERAEDNLHQIYGIERVPCDTSMREILDPVEPESLRPVFKQVFAQLRRGKALQEMEFVQGHYLLALDGTGYFSSKQIHCASCLETHHRNGTLPSFSLHCYTRAASRMKPRMFKERTCGTQHAERTLRAKRQRDAQKGICHAYP